MESYTDVGRCDTCAHAETAGIHSPCDACVAEYERTKKSPHWKPLYNNAVNHPHHYTAGSIECIDAIEASMSGLNFIGYCKGNAMKYLWRLGLKGDGLEDAKKAQWYINRIVKTMEEKR